MSLWDIAGGGAGIVKDNGGCKWWASRDNPISEHLCQFDYRTG